jgi:hypothetical protein
MSPSPDTLRSPGLANLCGAVRLVAILVVAMCLEARGFAAESRPAGADETVWAWARAELPALVETYRGFHAHPELSQQEKETAARLAALWREAGWEVTENVGGHGVVALLRNGAGPTVMLRTDLDGLPVTEQRIARSMALPQRSSG